MPKEKPDRDRDVDRRILEVVTNDASISSVELGKLVGLSSTAANDRLRRLKADGTILKTVAVIDPMKFSMDFLSFVRLKVVGTDKQSIVDRLEKISAIEEVHSIAGQFSLMLKVRTTNADAMEGIFEQIYDIPEILGSETDIAFRTYIDRPPQL
ncbi:MAG: Lrp/AsnC family transcriptional regulator [Litoreibacter sp.]